MKTLAPKLTHTSVTTFLDTVSRESHAMAGAVIAANAANAASLGRACIRISCQQGLRSGERTAAEQAGLAMDRIRHALRDWIDQDAEALAQVMQLRVKGQEKPALMPLFNGPVEIALLGLQACNHLQAFRPSVALEVKDDLELAIHLLVSAIQAAILLLESNLRVWPDEPFLSKYRPLVESLSKQAAAVSVVQHITA